MRRFNLTNPIILFCVSIAFLFNTHTAHAQSSAARIPVPLPTPEPTPTPEASTIATPLANIAATPENTTQAEAVLAKVLQTIGGQTYLQTRTQTGRGRFSAYADNVAGLPAVFDDTVVYPDKQRTEFRGSTVRLIQVNTGDSGWVYDGATRTIKDLTAAQVTDFRTALRASLDNLLRGEWRGGKDKATLSYIGRREAGIGRRNEAVRLTYKDGFAVEFEFGAKDNLPAKILYRRTMKKPDGGDDPEAMKIVLEEDRFAQFINVGGVLSPFVVDHFRDGKQTSRVNYETLEYNRPVADTVFARPTNLKNLMK